MFRPIQPQCKIRIFTGSKKTMPQPDATPPPKGVISSDGSYIDIEQCIAYPVTYEEKASLLNTLTFTVDKYADVLLYYFGIGQSVVLYGGYYADNESGMQHVFSGTVTRIKTKFADNGHVSFTVECMNYGFTKLGKDYKNFVYPDPNSKRKFAQSENLSVKDIIEGIARENNMEVGLIDLSSEGRQVNYDKINIRYQKNVTDWKFLNMLAADLGCNCWISVENGVDKINFVSNAKAVKMQSDIGFLFPLYGRIKDVREYEMQRFSDPAYDRPRLLRDVNVDEDIASAYSISRSAMYFDKASGEYKQSISRIEEKDGKTTVTFYELDEARVQYIHNTNPELAEAIRNGSPTGIPWGNPENPTPEMACYYYKAVTYYDDNSIPSVFDKAFFGITVTAKCNQDLNIRSQRTYKIRGILSYHSTSLETSFFLKGLKHVWDTDGTWTELEFMR